MRIETWLKLGQILGFVLLAGSFAVFVLMGNRVDVDRAMLMVVLLTLGILIYAGCRMAAWLRET